MLIARSMSVPMKPIASAWRTPGKAATSYNPSMVPFSTDWLT